MLLDLILERLYGLVKAGWVVLIFTYGFRSIIGVLCLCNIILKLSEKFGLGSHVGLEEMVSEEYISDMCTGYPIRFSSRALMPRALKSSVNFTI